MKELLTLQNIYYLVGILSFFVIIYQFISKNKRDARRNTIEEFNKVHELTFKLKDEIKKALQKEDYNVQDIANNLILKNKTMDYLTIMESFALSIQMKISDFEVFDKLISKKLLVELRFYLPFIEIEKNEIKYTNLFDCYVKMINELNSNRKFLNG
jgi:hypothetical protein